MTRSLLIIDGDSFAHRSYHALPKTIRRKGNRGGGAILGFANFLLRLYETEKPRAVLVAWDTLDEPTYRHGALADYQAGREFDTELIDQLEVMPDFVAAFGFANAKAPGYEADDFWRRQPPRRSGGELPSSQQAIAMPSSWLQPGRPFFTRSKRARWRGSGLRRCSTGMGSNRLRSLTHRAQGRRIGQNPWCEGRRTKTAAALIRKYGRSTACSPRVVLQRGPTTCGSIAPLRRWTDRRPCHR
jgi:5'-3' exonuclease-like protein